MRRGRGFGRLRALVVALAALSLLGLVPGFATAAANPDYLKSFGPDGTSSTSFEGPAAVAVDEETGVIYVGDRVKNVLYKFDSEGNPLDWSGIAPYIKGNEITGLSFSTVVVKNQVAVDPETHVIYVTSDNKVRAFEASGEAHEFTEGPGAGTSEIPGATELGGVAVDSKGNIYAADISFFVHTPRIRIYSRSGALLTEFESREQGNGLSVIQPTKLAIAPDGSLYVNGYIQPVFRLEPSQFPITASTTYDSGIQLEANFTESVAVDPTTSHVYVGEILAEASAIGVYDEDDKPVGTLGAPGEDGDLVGSARSIAVNGGGERVYVTDQGGAFPLNQVKVFETFTLPVIAPTVIATSAIDLNLYTATLRARVNPNSLESTYHFEYGLEDCEVSTCTSTPGGTIPAGHKPVAVSPREIIGLQPGTTYHYRVVAKNSKGETKGPDKTFTTPRAGLGFNLADSRAWEMVSPPNKFGGRIIQNSGGVMQAAADGNGLVYETVTSTEPNPDGNRAIDFSTTLSRRTGAGAWHSKDLTSPYTEVAQFRLGGEFKTFSPDLGSALLEQQGNTPLSPEASEQAPYLRENIEPATYRPLVTAKEGYANVPEGTVFGGGGSGRSPVAIRAADPALTHPVLRSEPPLVAGAEAGALYQWNQGQLAPVSELPESEGGAVVDADAGAGIGSVHNAVSEDGSRVFWGTGESVGRNLTGLYVRDTAGQTSGRLDLVAGGSGEGESSPAFAGASADGSVVFFSDSQRLTADASPADPFGAHTLDLYRCEVGPVEGGTLGCTSPVDVSAPLEDSGERAEVIGTVPGQSEDGARVYFFARGVLDSAPNEVGDSATAGEPNLYFWEEGQGTRFIATISPRDGADWGSPAIGLPDKAGVESKLSASASPDGRFLAFMSERSLTGYDNRDAKSDEAVEEVFRYDASEDRLDCISCNPSGASPEGKLANPTGQAAIRADNQDNWSKRWVGAVLPAAQESEITVGLAFHRPRVVHNNGRVFFNAIDPLVSADANGEWDVYQYEPTGTGDCTSSSEGAAIARSAGGCVSLLSSGTAEEEASFVDASEGGDDVFFITPARLSVTDEDEELDVYDTRVNGVPATLPVINECLGEACQAAPNPPNDPTPNSASFHGAGNVPSERCPESKRKVIREGHSRCVAKKHKQKKKHSHKAKKHKRANNNRRAGR